MGCQNISFTLISFILLLSIEHLQDILSWFTSNFATIFSDIYRAMQDYEKIIPIMCKKFNIKQEWLIFSSNYVGNKQI